MELHKRILASIDAHGTIPLRSLNQLFSHETEKDIEAALNRLVSDGWIKRRAFFMLDNEKCEQPCVSRTRKRMYTQPDLYEESDLK